MADIFHHFPIKASQRSVFEAVSTPEGLDSWWTKTAAGEPLEGSEYQLGFGPGYEWRARVSRCVPDTSFELELIQSDGDWQNTRVGFALTEKDGVTDVSFHHLGWPEGNEHYRISCYCWAMYLRVLKRYLEFGEVVAYEERLDV
ncbi:MAG TPA: SRPBCC domain-containing protein [Pyrinomonadaceae bacterium]|nr:SRPBCC domain-containing protein [Pyrinomonadaceae bacterium]